MIDLNDYILFRENKNTLKELSKDTSNNSINYVTESSLIAIDFDQVKRLYTNGFNHSDEDAASVDGIVTTTDGIAFIEFKNGNVKNRNIKDKLRDSLLIFCDITKKDLSYARENINFILVYNEINNPLPNQYTKEFIQPSSSRTFISKTFVQKGKRELILFDLEKYQKLFFKEVHTFTQEEFDNYLPKIIN